MEKYTINNREVIGTSHHILESEIGDMGMLVGYEEKNPTQLITFFEIQNIQYECFLNKAFDSLEEFLNFFKFKNIDDLYNLFEEEEVKAEKGFFKKLFIKEKNPVEKKLRYASTDYFPKISSEVKNIKISSNETIEESFMLLESHEEDVIIFMIGEDYINIYNGKKI